MPRSYPHTHVSHGRAVGYSVKKRANEPTYYVYFRGVDGRRLERDTNCTGAEKARRAAEAIIDAEYQPADENPDAVGWDEAADRLERRLRVAGMRDATVGYYRRLVRLVRAMYGATTGPADITPGMAQTLVDTLMSTPKRKGGKPRSAHYVAGVVNGLSALWEKWFVGELKIASGNPWQDVSPPKCDKLPVRYITDEQYAEFVGWLGERFGGWELPRLFFAVKEYTGCRLADLCSLRSSQLRSGRLHFDPSQTKGRKARAVPLPADLFESLGRIKGKTYLWEGHPAGLRAALQRKGWPAHRLNPVFSPARMCQWAMTLFVDFNADHPGRPPITSHQLRKRAFTRAYLAGVPLDEAAVAYGCGVDTIKRHYLGVDEQDITDAVFARLHPDKPARRKPAR